MSGDLTRCWSLFGGVLILSVALLNAGCCSHRPTVSRQTSETTEQLQRGKREAHTRRSEHAATLTNRTERQAEAVTEIEIYDTTRPPDSTTGRPPLKARIRQRLEEKARSRTDAADTGRARAETVSEDSTTHEGGTLDEVTVEATKAPGLWERIKQGAACAAAIMVLTAAGWIIFKIKEKV